jgi:hypothetical protein
MGGDDDLDHPEAGGPRNDDFHDHQGQHRATPPPSWRGTAMTWERDMRLHRESHGMARYVAHLLAGGR